MKMFMGSTPEPVPKVDRLTAIIQKSLASEIDVIVAEEAINAADRVERRVRAAAASISTRVLERFSVQHFGTVLRIEVEFGTNENNETTQKNPV